MKYNSIKNLGRSDLVKMGEIELRQPIPTAKINAIDPFILLHHYGPFEINEDNNPFDLGPHPHRGFEPVTFLLQGEQLHRDSLGNQSVVKAGDVQWTTAGLGVIHSEGPTKEFVKRGGTLEGIQLWINLPASKKMIPANYQHVKKEEFNLIITNDKKVEIQLIAGELENQLGKIDTQTSINAMIIDVEKEAETKIEINKDHQSVLYLISGDTLVNEEYSLKMEKNRLIEFNKDGEGFVIKGKEKSKLLFLSGTPLNEPVKSWGPYVMNTQSEILEALRDYQDGKMGFLER